MDHNEVPRTLNLNVSTFVLAQTECPRGHSKGSRPCHQLRDGMPLYCTARMDAASIRPTAGTWLHSCQGVFDLFPTRLLLSQRMRCPKCDAVFIKVPGEIEGPFRPGRHSE